MCIHLRDHWPGLDTWKFLRGWVSDDLLCLETLILSLLLREATAIGSLVSEGTRCDRKLKQQQQKHYIRLRLKNLPFQHVSPVSALASGLS